MLVTLGNIPGDVAAWSGDSKQLHKTSRRYQTLNNVNVGKVSENLQKFICISDRVSLKEWTPQETFILIEQHLFLLTYIALTLVIGLEGRVDQGKN